MFTDVFVDFQVIIGTGVSAGMNLRESYGVDVVGNIPQG